MQNSGLILGFFEGMMYVGMEVIVGVSESMLELWARFSDSQPSALTAPYPSTSKAATFGSRPFGGAPGPMP